MQDLPVMGPKTGVILVASGYVFRCPECDTVGYRPSALERLVSCEQCGSGFPVVEVRHRTSATDLAPGVAPDALYVPPAVPQENAAGRDTAPGRRGQRSKS